jgi:hypothetical protein
VCHHNFFKLSNDQVHTYQWLPNSLFCVFNLCS